MSSVCMVDLIEISILKKLSTDFNKKQLRILFRLKQNKNDK